MSLTPGPDPLSSQYRYRRTLDVSSSNDAAGDPEPSNIPEPRSPLKPLSFGPFDSKCSPSRVDLEDFGDEKGSFDWREPKFARLSDLEIVSGVHQGIDFRRRTADA